MIRDEQINAVAQGILSQEQAARRRDLARGPTREDDAADEPPVQPDDEKFRLIGGFNDIFVTIGVLLLVGALVGIARTVGFQTGIAVPPPRGADDRARGRPVPRRRYRQARNHRGCGDARHLAVPGLSAGWRSLRRMLLPLIPLGALRASVPPTA